MVELRPVELTDESFKDYGHVISNGHGNPMGDNEEFIYWGKLSQLKINGTASTGVLIGHKREPVIDKLERHVNTPEVLVALDGESVVCVAKPSPVGTDIIEGMQVFYVKQGEAFAMYEGTWHWIPIPVNSEDCKFLVVFASGTEENDLEVKDLSEEIKISI